MSDVRLSLAGSCLAVLPAAQATTGSRLPRSADDLRGFESCNSTLFNSCQQNAKARAQEARNAKRECSASTFALCILWNSALSMAVKVQSTRLELCNEHLTQETPRSHPRSSFRFHASVCALGLVRFNVKDVCWDC